MPLKRNFDWETAGFQRFLLARRKMPFAWGANDCALFAADAIESFTGTDIADDFRGKYTDEASAFRLVRKVTGFSTPPGMAVADAAAYCAVKHGLPEWQYPLQAQRGDLVVVENGGRLIAGVVHLNGKHVVSMAEDGPLQLSILAIKRAWRVI